MLDRLSIMIIPLLTLMWPLIRSAQPAQPLYRRRILSKIISWYELVSEVERKIDKLKLTEIEQDTTRISNVQRGLIEQVSVPLSSMG